MKKLLLLLLIPCLFTACKKDKAASDLIVNGINITACEKDINGYRTAGITGFPATTAINADTVLCRAAYKFALDIATEGDGANIYTTHTGKFILDYPAMVGFSGSANFALGILYPDNTSEKDIIDAAFNSASYKSYLMDVHAKKFGIGKYNNRWYLIYSN